MTAITIDVSVDVQSKVSWISTNRMPIHRMIPIIKNNTKWHPTTDNAVHICFKSTLNKWGKEHYK